MKLKELIMKRTGTKLKKTKIMYEIEKKSIKRRVENKININ
jgi:hypothetical protein